MSVSRQIYQWHGYRVEYLKYGSGKKTLICWHGFGQDAVEWRLFQSYFNEAYTVYAFSLFHHGESTYPDDVKPTYAFTPNQQKELLEDFFNVAGIHAFSVLAFSIGARLALWSCLWFKHRVENIYLLSPDGLPLSMINRLAITTKFGNLVFKYVTFQPKLLYVLAALAHKLKIISNSKYKFFIWHYNSKKQRMHVYNVWHAYSKLHPPLKLITKSIREYKIKGCIIAGRFDPLSNKKKINIFINNAGNQIIYHQTDAGHALTNKKNIPHIVKLLKAANQ